jgi:hypothetical protein
LAAVLTVDVNSSTDEMLWGLQVKNRSGFPRKLQVIFPVLGSFNIDNNLIDNYYYYPFESGLNGKIDCNMIAEYGNFAWMQLVSVYDPNSNAAIYAYPKDDSGGFKGIVLKKLFDGETPTVNNDCALLTREKPNMADVNKPIDVLDDVNDGIAFAYYYPMREIAAYHNYSYPKTVVRIYDGGWREALENYSCWVHSWYTPLNTPQWYKRCFFFGGQWDDEFYDDVNDTYVTSQSLQGHEDIIEWALWHDYNDVNLTAAQGLEAYQFGDYYYPQDRGGLTPMKDEIEACKDLGCQIMLYLSCRFCWTGTDTGLAYGQGWAAMFEPGTYTYNGGITTEKWLECQYEPNAWPDYIAEISGQIIADTCAVAFYIDEMPLSFPCYNPNHVHYQEDKFPCSADRMHQYINNLTSAVRAENSQAIVMGEYVGSEYLMQYFDGSWDQKYNGWSFTAPYYGEDSLNYFRFYFPEFKLALLGGADSDIDQRVLFNGIGVAGSSTAIIIGGGVLKENADAFSSLHLKPLIPTKVDRVLANEFSNDVNDKTVYTIYNKSGSDVNTSIIDVPHRSNYHYVELYYDTNNIVATQTDGNDTLTFAIDVNEVLCIAQLQQIIQATRNGPVISISLNQTDANDYLVAFYNEDTSYTGFSDAQTITLTDGTGQINVLDTFGGWKISILKLYRNDILFDEVIIPEPTPCLPGDVILWHLDEGSGTDSNDSESEGSYSILTLGEDYSWAAGCPNVPDSNYCLSSPSDSNSYCKSWIYPRDITAQLTLSAWIKPTSVDADGSSIVSVTNCFNLHFGNLTGDNIIRFICQAGATYPNVVVYDANATFFDDKWHQVKAVYDGVLDPNGNINLYLYIDGTLAVSSAIASGTSLPLGDSGGIGSYVYIGANAWGPDYFDSQRYRGAIDEVRLSNIAE